MDENKTIDVKLLTAWLDMMINDCENSIKNYPDAGSVKDNGRLGMKIAFQNVKSEIQDFKWKLKEEKCR